MRIVALSAVLVSLWFSLGTLAVFGSDERTTELAIASWGKETRSVAGLKGARKVSVGYPARQKLALPYRGEQPLPPGVYRLRLELGASHAHDEIAWHGALVVRSGEQELARFPAIDFARVHEPEFRTIEWVKEDAGPLELDLVADVEPAVFERVTVRGKLKPDGTPEEKDDEPEEKADDLVEELTVGLKPATHFYFLLERAELERVASVALDKLEINKVRYAPGEKLTGTVTVRPLGGEAAAGTLVLTLESGLNERVEVGKVPVSTGSKPTAVPFEIPLPSDELGYAIAARFVSETGAVSSVASEYFTILENFQRVSIWGSLGAGHGGTFVSPEVMRENCQTVRANYANAVEQFAWAEEDMVEMSPEEDVWYSGQTCYRISKAGLQRLIRTAHEHGIAMTTYGKFVMSGYIGWNTAWNYPQDHKGQFVFPVGMWEGANVQVLDRFRFKEFVPYEHGVDTGGLLNPFWQAFLPINPDPTPRMTRVAAEETVRSIEMFGWDGIRWDGHMRGGGPAGGGAGEFSFPAARKTQTLVRYFKAIVAEKHPRFRHGYNYLFVQDKPSYDWANDDFELDELCRGGGLLMNESIGNTTMGKPLVWLAENIQVEGDLARERGGYLLGISYADNPRDRLVESAFYFAGGCRPMGGTAQNRLINRYGTRFARYTFDERLRRLAQPEKVLHPKTETSLWWQPFVYETPRNGKSSQLVVNLLNVPQKAVTRGGNVNAPIDWTMPPGTEPVTFALTLVGGNRVTGAHLIDPFSLTVVDLPLVGATVSIPAVDVWRVLILDLESQSKSPTLTSLYGPIATFGVPRKDSKQKRFDAVVLDLEWPVEKLAPQMAVFDGNARDSFAEDPALAKLSAEKRNAALLARKKLAENQADAFLAGWWKGGSLPADLKLKETPPKLANLAPRHDGVCDVFLARGAMSHRVRVPEALAHLPTFRLAEATLGGFSVNYGLRGNLTPADLPRYDALVYADIPHGAIGPENSYALVNYVRAGGGVLFTGGQYSFGKGGYSWTVLDRELLPVQSVETVDTRISSAPLPLEPAADFAELGVKADFATRPSFYVYNQAALRPSAKVKVFLKSGNRPILVGWELGKGRVACLLATPMGQSTQDAPLYTEWRDWPQVLAAVVRWVAPGAGQSDGAGRGQPELFAAVLKKLGASKSEAALDELLEGDSAKPAGEANDSETLSDDEKPRKQLKGLPDDELRQRVAELELLLANPSPASATVLAQQMVSIPNLPDALRWRIALSLRESRTADLADIARPALASPDVRLRQSAVALLAAAGSPDFAALARNGVPESDVDRPELSRAVALAVALYPGDDLVEAAEAKLAAWDKLSAQRMKAYSGGTDFTAAAPPRPLLDSDALLARAGWLAYLCRQQPHEYAAAFARAWIGLAQLEEYCEITEAGLWSETQNATPARRGAVRAEVALVHAYRQSLIQAEDLARPTLAVAFRWHPDQVATGLSQAAFQREAEAAVRFLGRVPKSESAPVLSSLQKARNPLLAAFATERLRAE